MCIRVQTPWHVWAVGVAFFMFVLSGLAFHYANGFQPPLSDYLSAPFPEAQKNHDHWFTGVWALALWTSFIGAILILFRKPFAFAVLAFALTASAISLTFSLVVSFETLQATLYLFFRVATFLSLGFVVFYAREMEGLYVFR